MLTSSYIYSAAFGKFLESSEFQDTDPMLFVFFPPSSPLSSLYSSLSHVDNSDLSHPRCLQWCFPWAACCCLWLAENSSGMKGRFWSHMLMSPSCRAAAQLCGENRNLQEARGMSARCGGCHIEEFVESFVEEHVLKIAHSSLLQLALSPALWFWCTL